MPGATDATFKWVMNPYSEFLADAGYERNLAVVHRAECSMLSDEARETWPPLTRRVVEAWFFRWGDRPPSEQPIGFCRSCAVPRLRAAQ